MKQIRMKKRTAISIFLVLGIALALTASAAILPYFGQITTTATVEQSVQVRPGGGSWHNWDDQPVDTFTIPDAPGGESFCYKFWVWDRASIEAPIYFDTTVSALYPNDTTMEDTTGATATVYEFPASPVTLTLENKGTDWAPITGDGIQATLTFNPVSTTFDYDLTATGLTPSTGYALIYYSDQDPRFGAWGGDGGMVIATFTSLGDGTYTGSGNPDLGRNMPDGTDWNIHPGTTYQADSYVHWQGGAKIWIVPTADLTGGNSLPLIAWNPTTYLFETDLISYSDCNLLVVPWTMSLWGTEIVNPTIIPSGAKVPFFVCYAFDLAIMPGTYTMTTMVNVNGD